MSDHQNGAAVQTPSFLGGGMAPLPPQAAPAPAPEPAQAVPQAPPVKKVTAKKRAARKSAPAKPQGRPDGRVAYVSLHKTALTNHEGARIQSGGTIWLTEAEAAKLGKRVVKSGG